MRISKLKHLILLVALAVIPTLGTAQDLANQGKILSLTPQNETAEINLGIGDGVRVGDEFDIYSKPKIVIVAGAEAFQAQEVIGSMSILLTKADSSVGKYDMLPTFTAEVGQTVLKQKGIGGIKKQENQQPVVVNFEASVETATWGTPVVLRAEARDRENDELTYRWTASAGTLEADTTAGPTVVWFPPRNPNAVDLTVTASDATQTSEPISRKIAANGPPEGEPSETWDVSGVFGGSSKHFVKASYITFGNDNEVYVLDTELRRVICLNADWSIRWYTEQFPYRHDYTGVEFHQGRLFLLDQRACVVHSYAPAEDMFAPERISDIRTIGRKGKGNGYLRRPVDFTIGEDLIFILDRFVNSIQVFSTDGEFQVSFGLFEAPEKIVALDRENVAVLDRNEKGASIYLFRDFQLSRSPINLDRSNGVPVGLARGDQGENFHVICEDRVLRYDRNGSRIQATVSADRRLAFPIEMPIGGSVDRLGRLIVLNQEGQSLLRFSTAGDARDAAWGVFDMSASPVSLTVEPDGDFHIRETSGAIWSFDRQGWVTARHTSTDVLPVGVEGLTTLQRPTRVRGSKNGLLIYDEGRQAIMRADGPGFRRLLTVDPGKVANRLQDFVANGDGLIILESPSGGRANLRVYETIGEENKFQMVPIPVGAGGVLNMRLQTLSDGNILMVGDAAISWTFNPKTQEFTKHTEAKYLAAKRVASDGHNRTYILEKGKVTCVLAGAAKPLTLGEDGRYGRDIRDIGTDHSGNVYLLNSDKNRIIRLLPTLPQ